MPGGFPSIGLDVCNGFNPGVDSGNALGIGVTGSSLTHTKGSWQSLGFITYDCCLMRLSANPSGGGFNFVAMDIGIGSSGSQQVVIPNLVFGTDVAGGLSEVYPLQMPAGTNVWARLQGSAASQQAYVSFTSFDGGFDQHDGINGYDALGFASTRSNGTAIAKSTLGAKGAYTELIAATTRDYTGFAARWNFELSTSISGFTTFLFDIAIGSSGNEKIIIPDISMWQIGVLTPANQPFIPIRIPAGTRISARGACAFSSGFTNGLTLYGGYK